MIQKLHWWVGFVFLVFICAHKRVCDVCVCVIGQLGKAVSPFHDVDSGN